jgi:pyridoxamine 5'-phosphate oxidase
MNEEIITLFKTWYEEALKNDQLHEPNTMSVATASKDGKPSVRILLLRGYDHRGFCFYTNLTSKKGKELAENPYASLCFYWDHIDKQVRIDGKVERLSEKEADQYFANRQRGSQIGAWASKQSMKMDSDEELIKRVKTITEQFKGQTIPRPPFWSGYRLIPNEIEFWDKKEFRLHKRLQYTKTTHGWKSSILFP